MLLRKTCQSYFFVILENAMQDWFSCFGNPSSSTLFMNQFFQWCLLRWDKNIARRETHIFRGDAKNALEFLEEFRISPFLRLMNTKKWRAVLQGGQNQTLTNSVTHARLTCQIQLHKNGKRAVNLQTITKRRLKMKENLLIRSCVIYCLFFWKGIANTMIVF